MTQAVPEQVSDAHVYGSLHIELESIAMTVANHAKTETPKNVCTLCNVSTGILLADCCRRSHTVLHKSFVEILFTAVSDEDVL